MSVAGVIQKIEEYKKQVPCVLVGVDGHGGSGKSTLAKDIAEQTGAILIQSDHFYKTQDRRAGEHRSTKVISDKFDWDELQKAVFDNAKPKKIIKYRPYSWDIEGLLPEVRHTVGQVIIVEGVYTLQDKFLDKYHLKVWVDAPEEVRLTRGVQRDGEEMRSAWTNIWIPQDRRYFEACRPDKRADIIIVND